MHDTQTVALDKRVTDLRKVRRCHQTILHAGKAHTGGEPPGRITDIGLGGQQVVDPIHQRRQGLADTVAEVQILQHLIGAEQTNQLLTAQPQPGQCVLRADLLRIEPIALLIAIKNNRCIEAIAHEGQVALECRGRHFQLGTQLIKTDHTMTAQHAIDQVETLSLFHFVISGLYGVFPVAEKFYCRANGMR